MSNPKISDQFNGVIKSKRLLRAWEFGLEFQDDGIKNEMSPVLVSATTFPGREVSDIELPIGGTTIRYPGPPTYNGNWTVTFRDFISLSIRKSLDKYMGSIAWFDAGIVKPTFQKQLDIVVGPEDAGNPNNILSQIILENAYISNIGDAVMDYGNEALATYEVTLNYQRWYFT